MLLIFSVPGCMRKCFVCDSDTQGREGLTALFEDNKINARNNHELFL